MTADDGRHVARQRVQQTFKLADPGQIEVIGRLVQQQDIGFRHQRAGQHGKPLPAAAELLQRLLTQRLGDFELLQRHIDAPAFARLSFGGQHLEHDRSKRRVHQRRRHVLCHIAHGHAARPRDLAFRRLKQAGDTSQQRGLAASVGGDETDPVAGIDDEVKLSKQRRAQRHAEIADVDESHDRSLVLPSQRDRPRARSHHRRFASSAAIDRMRSRREIRSAPHGHEGQTRMRFWKRSLVSPANAFAGH